MGGGGAFLDFQDLEHPRRKTQADHKRAAVAPGPGLQAPGGEAGPSWSGPSRAPRPSAPRLPVTEVIRSTLLVPCDSCLSSFSAAFPSLFLPPLLLFFSRLSFSSSAASPLLLLLL